MVKTLKYIALAVLIISDVSHAADVPCSGDISSALTSAISSASVGDTINILTGTCSIGSTVNINKGVSVIGAGIASTTISVPSASDAFLITHSSGTARLSGFTTTGSITTYSGVIEVRANNTRIDTIRFNCSNDRHMIYSYGDLYNVVIHDCTFESGVRGINNDGSAYWSTASLLDPGTSRAVYIEDCAFNASGVEVTDAQQGGSYVVRNCSFLEGGNIAMHGADSGDRSAGYIESYHNTFNNGGTSRDIVHVLRGGIQFIFNITVENVFNSPIKMQNKRSCYPNCGPYASSNQNRCQSGSSNPYDQELDSTGWTCKDQIGIGPNQTRYGSYFWEIDDQGPSNFGVHVNNCGGCSNPSTGDHIQEGRDYFYDEASTNPIQRVTTAPTTCSTQYAAVWYDEDNDGVFDDGIPSGNPETLYQCDGSNYQAYYTPYTYPHPLRSDSDTTAPTVSGSVKFQNSDWRN